MIRSLGEQDSKQPAKRERCIAQVQRFISIRTLMAEGTLRITCRHLKIPCSKPKFYNEFVSEMEVVESWEKEKFPLTNTVIEC